MLRVVIAGGAGFIGGQRDGINFEAGDVIHEVNRFANGADLTLNGDALSDPAINTGYVS